MMANQLTTCSSSTSPLGSGDVGSLAVRAGAHHGPATWVDDDLFDHTVNVAARVAGRVAQWWFCGMPWVASFATRRRAASWAG